MAPCGLAVALLAATLAAVVEPARAAMPGASVPSIADTAAMTITGFDLDRDAVNAALTQPCHNGGTEGVHTKCTAAQAFPFYGTESCCARDLALRVGRMKAHR